MDIEIKKDLASNWFKLLQNAICDDISRLEKNRVKFKSTSWQRSKKKMRVVVNIELLLTEKFLKK
jgi:coproporphyrinogen III oxidase